MKKLAVLVGGVMICGASYAGDYSVSYSPQDLRSIESVQTLHQEIVDTAKDYCPSYSSVRSLADRRRCVSDVVTDLVVQVDSPTLTAYHRGEVDVQVAQASK